MPGMLPPLEYWFQARKEQVGIILLTDNRELLMNRLYAARAEYHKTYPNELDGLSICLSPTSDQELWIVHKIVRTERVEDGQS